MGAQVGAAEGSQHGLARTSLNSDVARPVTVVNETAAPVELYWVNYDGAPPGALSHYILNRHWSRCPGASVDVHCMVLKPPFLHAVEQ